MDDRLMYESSDKVLTADGQITAEVSMTLGQMKLIDVIKLQIVKLDAVLLRLKQQLAELEATPEA